MLENVYGTSIFTVEVVICFSERKIIMRVLLSGKLGKIIIPTLKEKEIKW